jgi:hypothetical protein
VATHSPAVFLSGGIEMNTGKFIDFYLPYQDEKGRRISSDSQASRILEKTESLLAAGSLGVGILYSANYQQTVAIQEAYGRGDYKTGINGANQAAVMNSMEKLLDDARFQALRGKICVCPLTTLSYGSLDPIAVVGEDLDRVRQGLESGRDILGWHNQTTIKSRRYAIGGGVAGPLPPDIDNLIQSTLHAFANEYR